MPLDLLDAAQSVLHSFQGIIGSSEQFHTPYLEVRPFKDLSAAAVADHVVAGNPENILASSSSSSDPVSIPAPSSTSQVGGAAVTGAGEDERGLFATRPLQSGSLALMVPERLQVTEGDLDAERFEGASFDNRALRFALWFAEKRSELVDHPMPYHVETPGEEYWTAYLRHLPPLESFEARGLPVVAPEADLRRLESLPLVGQTGHNALEWRYVLGQALAHYNTTRGARPKLAWRDALWGLANVVTRAFQCYWPDAADGNSSHVAQIIAPIADLVNHGSEPNVQIQCDTQSHAVQFAALRPITPGEELVFDYVGNVAEGMSKAVTLVGSYGMVDGAKGEEHWGSGDCAELRGDHIGRSDDGPMLQLVGRLVDKMCPPHAEEIPAAGAEVAAVSNTGDLHTASNEEICREPGSEHLTRLAQEELQAQGQKLLDSTFGDAKVKVLGISPWLAILSPIATCTRRDSLSRQSVGSVNTRRGRRLGCHADFL